MDERIIHIDRWTTYSVRAAAIVLVVWFGYQGIQRIVVDHIRALQRVQQQDNSIKRGAQRFDRVKQQLLLCQAKATEAVKK